MTTAIVRHLKRTQKKTKKQFKRFQSDRFKRVKTAWRKPRGIDNRVRRRFKGAIKMPKIGYGTNKFLRHRLPNGYYNFVVKNAADLEMMVMQKDRYVATFSRTLSARTRKTLLERANQIGVTIMNKHARLTTEENQ